MSSARDGQAASRDRAVRSSEAKILAEDFIALIDEFEVALSQGRAPPVFAERLAQLIQFAQRLD